jgi:HSP20 family protein
MNMDNNRQMMRKPTTALSRRPSPLEMRVTPVADIFETSNAFVVKLDMPGATKETVRVAVEPGALVATGEVAPLHRDGADLMVHEITRKSYVREFTLGQGASHENVQASYEEGVLTITVQKTEDAASKTIQIR